MIATPAPHPPATLAPPQLRDDAIELRQRSRHSCVRNHEASSRSTRDSPPTKLVIAQAETALE
jgi:hypothetical protein